MGVVLTPGALRLAENRYPRVVVTGGIGAGQFFQLRGNHDLGRNESRMAHMLEARDFCKGHIIAHYAKVLLGGAAAVQMLGAVGGDEEGERLLRLMRRAGIDVEGVKICDGKRTLFCVCFQYPDSSGGNITESESASNEVRVADVDAFLARTPLGGKCLVVAAAEVPLESRLHLLRQAHRAGARTVASCNTDEVRPFVEGGGLDATSLFAANEDEAAALVGPCDDLPQLRQKAAAFVAKRPHPLALSITLGARGSLWFDRRRQGRVPAIEVGAAATGGAGDAYLSGLLCGLCAGLSPLPSTEDAFDSACQLGIAAASLSVTSCDTIHFGLDATAIREHLRSRDIRVGPALERLLGRQDSPA